MGDFTLPSLPPDFVPNFLTQPNPINNNNNFPDTEDRIPLLTFTDESRPDRFPLDNDGVPFFLNEFDDAFKNLAQDSEQEWTLSREQWVEIAALYSQALVKGLVINANGQGAVSLKHDLPLKSRTHLVELAKNVEKLNR